MFPTKNIPSKYAESINFDAKRLGKSCVSVLKADALALTKLLQFLSKKEIENLTFSMKDRFLFHSRTPKAVFSIVASPLMKIPLLLFVLKADAFAYTKLLQFLSKKRNRKFDFFNERLFFISLMNTKSGIFNRGFATHENTAFVVHSVK